LLGRRRDLPQRDQLEGEELKTVTLDAILPGPAGEPEAAFDVDEGPLPDHARRMSGDLLKSHDGNPLHIIAAPDRDA